MRTFKLLKKNYIIFLLGLLLAVTSCSFTTKKIDPGDNDKEEVLTELLAFVLSNYHYAPKDINDDFSKKIYDEFLKTIDSQKRFFLKSDVEEFEKYRESIDDEIKNHKVDFFNLVYDRLQKRMGEMEDSYQDLLAKPFDFSEKQTINTDYKNADYPATKKEREKRWMEQLKFNTLSSYYDLKKEQKENLEKDEADRDDGFEEKSDAELEVEARKTTRHSLEQFYDLSKDLKRKDWFGMYLNTIANEFDPHTGYFAPQDKENFDIRMSGSVEGIGAQLQKDMDNIKITKLISGGPAWTDGRLEVGDLIKKVKQEDEDKAVSIVGMSISDAVELIRGKKGSKVTLTVEKVDGTKQEIELVRDIVQLEETYAKSAVTEKNGKKFGMIKLPSFYFNMEDYNKRNAASDMKKEIDYLKNQNIDGLVIDLRNNGGGSLTTAIDIAGLFFKTGPVVQVRSGDDKVKVLKDKNPSVEWDGPLVIMVNELSASASEILAAAMQDYGRAIIIGSKQTYGKGTVQRFLDLNSFMRSEKLGDMGSLKITTQKFYRINGGATQLRGVNSDVVVPDRYSYIDIGERDNEAPLPWDEIERASYKKWDGYTNFDEVVKNSQKRIKNNETFNLIDKNAHWIKKQKDKNVYPLSYEAYNKEVKNDKKKAEHFKSISDYESNLTFSSLPEEVARFEADSTLAEKRERWHKNLSQDVYVDEAIHILGDLELSKDQQKKMAKAKRD